MQSQAEQLGATNRLSIHGNSSSDYSPTIQTFIKLSRYSNADVKKFLEIALKLLTFTQLGGLLRNVSQTDSARKVAPIILRRMVETFTSEFRIFGSRALRDLIPLLCEHQASSILWQRVLDLMKERKSDEALHDQIQLIIRSVPKALLYPDLVHFQIDYFQSIPQMKRQAGAWKMETARTSCKMMEEFLKGTKKSIVIEGQFNSIAQARAFRIEGKGFSVDYEATGAGKSAQVRVTKNQLIFGVEKSSSDKAKKELSYLRQIKLMPRPTEQPPSDSPNPDLFGLPLKRQRDESLATSPPPHKAVSLEIDLVDSDS